MVDYTIVEAKPWHCGQMVRMLRDEHQRALAMIGVNSHRELRNVFDDSFFRRACLVDGKLIAIWGVTGPAVSSIGLVWLALSKEIERFPVALVKEVRQQLDEMMLVKRNLIVGMLEGDETSKRFAVFLGFVPALNGEYVLPAGTRYGRKEVARKLKESDEVRFANGAIGKLMIYRGSECHS